MPGYQRQRIWDERPLTDEIKASILAKPDAHIIASSTSNAQFEPCCLVVVDHSYPLIGVLSVTVKRSRNTESNTASISLLNTGVRYSGPNKQKISANTPISIYMGYSKRYIQRFEGYIDSTSMSTTGDGSTIQIECRDRAKDLIENEISCGIYSDKSEYLGEGDWHFQMGYDRFSTQMNPEPRAWKVSDVLRDVCYVLGLRDIVPFIHIEENYNTVTGFTTYDRVVTYGPEYVLDIDPEWDKEIVCNFVEENALDVIAQLAQSICHEAFFDQLGRLVVRKVQTAADPSVFYYKEERDIESLTNKVDDDNVSNIITITGQTADETAVIYPFGAVAVTDNVSLEKGQDKYGWTMTYPKIVGPENINTLKHPSLYAHTMAPGAEPVTDYHDNPENGPSYDVRIHYPNFAQPYEKQLCLEATCPIITDEAAKANTNNLRTWGYHGEVDSAVSYENQPIMLEDRFRKPLLVVCKERSMDDDLIKACDATVSNPEAKDDPDEDADPVPMPSVLDHITYSVDGGTIYDYNTDPNYPSNPLPTPNYGGLPTPGVANSYYLVGTKDVDSLPSDATAFVPKGLTAADFQGKGKEITQFSVVQGVSPWASLPNYIYDMASMSTLTPYIAMVKVKRKIKTKMYQDPTNPAVTYRAVENLIDPTAYDEIEVIPFDLNPQNLYVNCQVVDNQIESMYTPWRDLPSGAIDMGGDQVEEIEYPLIYHNPLAGLTGTQPNYLLAPISDDWMDTITSIKDSCGKSMEVFITKIDPRYVSNSDPDVNCVYWKWRGTYKKDPTKSDRGVVVQTDMGADANGNPKVSIKKDEFYRLAADPNTVVIECTTAGIDHKSWAEVVELNEYNIICKGHNQYGSMKDSWEKFIKELEKILTLIGAALVIIGIAFLCMPFGGAAASGVAQGGIAPVTAALAILLGVFLILLDLDDNIGANISKVMEDMSCRLTGVRRPEIELWHNSSKAAQWYIRDQSNQVAGSMAADTTATPPSPFGVPDGYFGYEEGSTLNTIYQPNNQESVASTGLSRAYTWVFLMDLTKAGSSGPALWPNGPWVTAVGWETPEVGDRRPIEYYTQKDYDGNELEKKEIITRFAIEAFGDDTRDPIYTAEELVGLRFENNTDIGIVPGTAETWYNSTGYELLVDRSMNEMAVSDNGFWFDFFEKKDNFVDRRYKYIALVIYSWRVKTYNPDGTLKDDTEYITRGSTPDPKVIFAHTDAGEPCRWGLFVPRGLNPQHYNRWRWLEQDTLGNDKEEQNYTHVSILWAGQEKLIANLINNFKYSAVQLDFRVWGKAYGTFAPTIVYYSEANLLSWGSYGNRELSLNNNCINDFKTARKLANMLTAQSNETYNMVTTGKPYVFEGDVVMVKEETSGSIAGMFRNWENIWKDPERKNCVDPGNQLTFRSIPGVYQPQYSTPTYGNNTLVACSDGTRNTYLVEIDKAYNPIWYAIDTANTRPVFCMRWEGVGGQYNANVATHTLAGLADGSFIQIDYTIANLVNSLTLPAVPTCGTMDEEQLWVFVGSDTGVYGINLATFTVDIIDNSGGCTGISAAQWKVYDPILEEEAYREYGVLFTVGSGGITCRQLYQDRNRTAIGPVLATYTGNLPFDEPGTLEYDKSLGELIYVHKAQPNKAASIHSIKVEVEIDPSYPDAGFDVEFIGELWKIDYMDDGELIATFPNTADRTAYINQFFRPVHAIYDVNKDLLITDEHNNRVYKVNPSGKFYITSITDNFDIGDNAVTYKQQVEMVTVAAAGSLQLTNFGKNFLNTKTDQQITAAMNTGMGRIISELGRDKYLCKLLTSATVVEAINNSAQALRVRDTVIIMFGFNGDMSGVGTIIAKKALNDWLVETGDPYVYTDATSIDVTKYGQAATETTSGGSTADLTVYNSRIRTIENRLKTLAGLHGLRW